MVMSANRQRFVAPGSSTGLAGVVVLEGEGKQVVYSHHGSDPLGDGKPHDAFDVLRIVGCGGDFRRATNEARRRLGLPSFEIQKELTDAKPLEVSPKSGLTTIDAQQLMALSLPEVPQVVPGLFPVGLTIFAGKPKTGKSWLILDTAHAVASDGYILGKIKVQDGEALVLALEDSQRRLQSRLSTLTDNVPKSLHLSTSLPRMDEGGLTLISSWLEQHPNARYVVIDTLARVKPRRAKNADIYAEDALVGKQLQELAVKHNVALVVVHHLRKAIAEDPLDTVSGSTGLTGAADAVIVLTRTRGQGDATLYVTGRDLEEQYLTLMFQPEKGKWLLVGETKDFAEKENPHELNDSKEWLNSQLVKGALPAQKLLKTAKSEGISERTLKRAKEKLGVKSRRESVGNKGAGIWFWYLEDHRDVQNS
jgi:hypothetical protein